MPENQQLITPSAPRPMLMWKDPDEYEGAYQTWLANVKHANLPRLSAAPCDVTPIFLPVREPSGMLMELLAHCSIFRSVATQRRRINSPTSWFVDEAQPRRTRPMWPHHPIFDHEHQNHEARDRHPGWLHGPANRAQANRHPRNLRLLR